MLCDYSASGQHRILSHKTQAPCNRVSTAPAATRSRRLQVLSARIAVACASQQAGSVVDELVAPLPVRSMTSPAHHAGGRQHWSAEERQQQGSVPTPHQCVARSRHHGTRQEPTEQQLPDHQHPQQQQHEHAPAPAYQQAPPRPDLPSSTADADSTRASNNPKQMYHSSQHGHKQQQRHRHPVPTSGQPTTTTEPARAQAAAPSTKISPWTSPPSTPAVASRAELPPLKRPPVAPEDPQELLQLLGTMPPPPRKVVVYKGGGYIYEAAEQLLEKHGLQYAIRMTNLLRKAHCIVSVPVWDNGRRANLKEHQSAAAKRGLPFYVLQRFEVLRLVEALRPLLIKRRILRERSAKTAMTRPKHVDSAPAGGAESNKHTLTRQTTAGKEYDEKRQQQLRQFD